MHAYQPERLKPKPSGRSKLAFVKENPALSGGAALSIMVMGAVFVNAIWYQPGPHPAPLFSTRAAPEAISMPSQSEPKLVRAEPQDSVAPAATETASADLLREIQSALSVRGYYDGKLDGVYGSRTKRAINSFQADAGLNVDGEPTVRLLTQVLLSASSRPAEVPVPKAPQAEKRTVEVKAVKVPTIESQESRPDGLIAQIQSGLRAYGYDELKVDGKMGQNTATAIQRFQLDYGMKITGEPSETVLQKLREIGAYRQG
ncbi:MAG: peptidoglycan-binding domain-containing protein [Ahrensia sp.]|nr:peptidoglycan-binding domain-containing protein [Ahrensia sp.]